MLSAALMLSSSHQLALYAALLPVHHFLHALLQSHEEILSVTSGAPKPGTGAFHSQDERQSTFATQGSSNYLCAKRDEEARGSGGGTGGHGQGFSGSK